MRLCTVITRFLPALLGVLVADAALAQEEAKERFDPRIRIHFGYAAGEYSFEEIGSNADDETDADLFRFHVEGLTDRGIGGGIRTEFLISEGDLFRDAGFLDTEARQSNFFGHFTYHVASHRFSMPVRAGFLVDFLTLEEEITENEIDYLTFGGRVEFAPEVMLVRSRDFGLSMYGEFGMGFGFTTIEVNDFTGDDEEFEAGTFFLGLEAGMRMRFGRATLGAAYLGRWQSMDESEEEDGVFVLGYDADFHGLLLNFGITF
jgi:hypothetical protein